MTPLDPWTVARRVGVALTEARVYLEDATRELRTAQVTLTDADIESSAATVAALLDDIRALTTRIHDVETDWQARSGKTAA